MPTDAEPVAIELRDSEEPGQAEEVLDPAGVVRDPTLFLLTPTTGGPDLSEVLGESVSQVRRGSALFHRSQHSVVQTIGLQPISSDADMWRRRLGS